MDFCKGVFLWNMGVMLVCENLKQSLQKLSAGGFLQRVAVDLQEDLWRCSSWVF